MWFDLALEYDAASRSCDLVLGPDCDLAIDETPITPMLLSIGLDRRANPDDPLPSSVTEFSTPTGFAERRGWAGDGLDRRGERTGSRLWLLDRAKQTNTTRAFFRLWLDECLAWMKAETGRAAQIEVEWVAREMLGWRAVHSDSVLERVQRFA